MEKKAQNVEVWKWMLASKNRNNILQKMIDTTSQEDGGIFK